VLQRAVKPGLQKKRWVEIEETDWDQPGDTQPPTPRVVEDNKDEKNPKPGVPVALGAPIQSVTYASAAMHRMFQRRSRSTWKGVGKNKVWNYRPFCCDLVERTTLSSGSGTAYFPVKYLQPNNSTLVTEAAQLASLFDMMRCVGVTVRVRCTTTLQVIEGAWSLVFDASNIAPYTSVAGTLISGQMIGPIAFNFASGTMSHTMTGFIKKDFRPLEALPPTSGGGVENIGKSWIAAADTMAAVGYLKYAADAIAGGSTNFDTFIVYHMEYKERT